MDGNQRLITQVTETAHFIAETQGLPLLAEDERALFEVGVSSGCAATIVALRLLGHLPPEFGEDPA